MGRGPWALPLLLFLLLLLLLLLIPARAQSGTDGDPTVECSSHINMKQGNSLTCQLDIDDAEEVTDISLCWRRPDGKCKRGELKENKVIFNGLEILKKYQLRILFVTGESFREVYDLRSIIKPTAPWIINATFLEKSGTAPIHIGTQYHQDYLSENLEFELAIAGAEHAELRMTVLHSPVIIESSHLKCNTNYSVRVRARPKGDYFKGTWSGWSPSASFRTATLRYPDNTLLVYTLIAAALILLLIVAMAILQWRKAIKSSIWPKIPNPENTHLHMYKPNKALPISFNPEDFSDQMIHLVDRIEEAKSIELEVPGGWLSICEVAPTGWSPADVEGAGETGGGAVARTAGPSDAAGGVQGGSWPKTTADTPTGRGEEPYVTMSSFINTQ